MFVEKNPQSLKLLKENIALFMVGDRSEILTNDALSLPKESKAFDVIFMDPPYGKGLTFPALESLMATGWIGPATLVIVEREEKDEFEIPEGMEEVRVLKQGKRHAHFLETA